MKSARSLLFCAGSITALLATYSAHATDGTWTGTNAGTWDTTATNWSGVSGTPWDTTNGPTDKAIFATAGDLATINGTVYTGGITFNDTAAISNGGNSANSIKYAADNSSMALSVATGISATINANINYGGTGGTGDILNLTGGGTLTLSQGATLAADDGNAKSSYFSVDGGSTLNLTGGTLRTMIDNSSNRGSAANPYLGNSSSNNTLNVSGSGKMITGNFNIGTSGNNGNSAYVSAAGTSAAPTWLLYGNSAQLNMNSSNNLVQISNGAFIQQTSGGGTGAWCIGNASGSNGNQLVVTGLGSTLVHASSSYLCAGGNNTAGTSGGSNNLIKIQAGGLAVGGRVGAGFGNDTIVTADNAILVTGTSGSTPSYYREIASASVSNTNFLVGGSALATGNSFRVEAGARADIFGSGTGKNLGIGMVAGANNNYVSVSGVGSVLNFITGQELTVGGNASVAGGSGNHVDVYDGGSLIMSNVDGAMTLPASVSWTTWAANPTTSTAMVLAGASSALNIGNGTGNTSLVKIGSVNGHTGVELANATSTLNFNNGRLTAGVTGALVSGAGTVNLLGPAYISTASGFTNTISTAITGVGSLTKEGAGTLDLTYLNTYTGDTTVTATGGVLKMENAYLADGSTVNLFTGGKLNLNTGGATDTIGALYLDGVLQTAPGTWGSSASGAANQNDSFFSGSGMLLVAAVPEPTAALLGGLGLLSLLRRRRSV